MKRILSFISLALCVIFSTVFIAGCGSSTKWLQPNFNYNGEGLTVEFVTNAEKDFEFPIKGLEFEHSKFDDERILEYGWIIYNGEHEIVGWIEAGNGYDINKKGNYKYGFSTSYNNGVYGYSDTNFCLVLKSTDLTIFDRIEFTSDYGSIALIKDMDYNPVRGSFRYTHLDEELNRMVPNAGAENFVCCLYALKLDSIDPDETKTINITFSLKDK